MNICASDKFYKVYDVRRKVEEITCNKRFLEFSKEYECISLIPIILSKSSFSDNMIKKDMNEIYDKIYTDSIVNYYDSYSDDYTVNLFAEYCDNMCKIGMGKLLYSETEYYIHYLDDYHPLHRVDFYCIY